MINLRAEAVAALTRRLGYSFRTPALLEQALTHPSVGEGAGQGTRTPPDNQRLEFLGDRVLGLLAAESLMRRYPEADEGDLSARLHALVDKPACARAAEALGIGAALRLSPGEAKSGGRRREGALGDAMEAVLAALYLDGGLEAASDAFESAWAEMLDSPPPRAVVNPKSALQEWAMKQALPLPKYRILGRTGSDHAPTFTVEAAVEGYPPLTAEGRSRQDAEKAAATALLKREGLI